MNAYKWLSSGVNMIQDGRHSQLTLNKIKMAIQYCN